MLIIRRSTVLIQHLVQSLCVSSRPVCRLSISCSTCTPDGHLHRVTIPDAVLIQLTSWWWARVCSKHVGNWNKRIIWKNFASSWSPTRIYIEMHGQQYIKFYRNKLIQNVRRKDRLLHLNMKYQPCGKWSQGRSIEIFLYCWWERNRSRVLKTSKLYVGDDKKVWV